MAGPGFSDIFTDLRWVERLLRSEASAVAALASHVFALKCLHFIFRSESNTTVFIDLLFLVCVTQI